MTEKKRQSADTADGLPLRWERFFPLIPGLVVVLVFGRVVGFDFVWDDANLIAKNAWLDRSDTLWRVFVSDFWELTNSPKATGMYRPVVLLSYWAEHQIWQENPFGYHLTNMVLHAGVASLLYAILTKLTDRRLAALMGALIFAVHPVQVEAVANIASRPDLLATLSVLAGLLFWSSASSKRWLALPCLLLGVFSKESAIIGPLLALLVADRILPSTRNWIDRIAPLTVLPIYGAFRYIAISEVDPFGWNAMFSDWKGPYIALRYVGRVLLPLPQAPITDLPHPGWFVVGVSSAVLALAAALVVLRLEDPRIRLALGWIAVSLVPVTEMVPVGARYADLLLYLPMGGVALLIACSLPRHRAWVGGASLLVVACCVVSGLRATHWSTNKVLWTHGLEIDPTHPTMQMNLATALRAEGEVELGCRALERTLQLLELRPLPDTEAKAHYNLGNCQLQAQRYRLAAAHYRRSLDVSGGEIHQAHHNLVIALMNLGRSDEARIEAQRFTQDHPTDASAWRVLGFVQAQAGFMHQAVKAFEASLRLQPDDGQTQRMLAVAREKAAKH